MRYDKIKDLGNEKFRRLTGVKKTTFEEMAKIISDAFEIKKAHGGRPNKLMVQDMVLLTLEYLREYRTYFHIGKSYGLSESNVCRKIKWVEDTLIKCGTFSLPGKKALSNTEKNYKVILVDATESPIERPKKNKRDTRVLAKLQFCKNFL
jgi:hypothetical protein